VAPGFLRGIGTENWFGFAKMPASAARSAKAAGAGEMLNIHALKAAYEKANGHDTSNSTVYNFLARHGWRKLMPRPFHPKRGFRRFFYRAMVANSKRFVSAMRLHRY
jgi:hypothetical protein